MTGAVLSTAEEHGNTQPSRSSSIAAACMPESTTEEATVSVYKKLSIAFLAYALGRGLV